jgi:RNA polymerase-binding transcription factor DksA
MAVAKKSTAKTSKTAGSVAAPAKAAKATKPAPTKAAKATKATGPGATKSTATKPAAAKAAKATKPAPTKAAPATTTRTTKAAPTKPASSSKPATPTKSTPATMSTAKAPDTSHELPKPKFNKDGLGYTKDFDLAFIKEQHDQLQTERIRLTGQALRLEAEAHLLVEEAEMGDVRFDDEGGEGDTMSVERERDLALSAQAREAIDEIDAALKRIAAGTYGYSVVSGKPIPRERLEAIPWSSVLVEEKVGGIGRR